MNFMRPLRNELFRYRKRKQISLDGTVGGLDHRAHGAKPVQADIGAWGPPAPDYVSPPAQSYEPHPGFAQFPEPEYEAYDPAMPHHFTPMIRAPGPPNMPGHGIPAYTDSLMTEEMFEQALHEVSEGASAEPVPLDNDVTANELMHSPDSLEQVIAGPMPADPVHEIEAAMDQQMQQMEAQMTPEPMPDPFLEEQQMYDEQMQQLMNPYAMPGMMGPGPMGPMGPGPMM